MARCAVLTISDTRTVETDESGPIIERLIADAGHQVVARAIVRDEPDQIRDRLRLWIDDDGIDVVVSTGGTGIARRDTTIEVVREMLTSELEGFGELFRMLSYGRVKSFAMLSRAVGGLAGETFVFALPGSTDAVETGVGELIAPQLSHLIDERRR